MKEAVSALKRAVKSARTALIVSHIDPDGDSLGSMLAMGLILNQLGIYPDYYSQDGVPKVYRFLPGADKVKNRLEASKHYDLLLAMDSSDLARLGDKFSPREAAKIIINIDHHPDNTRYGDINYVEQSSSTAELVYRIAREIKIELNQSIAVNLYVALITDTGNYRYENTTVETFNVAADLIRAGVDTHAVTTRIYDNRSLASVCLQSCALGSLETSADYKAAWATVTEEMMKRCQAKSEDLIGLVDMVRSIEGVEVAILFREDGDKVKINFRSKDKINVSQLAKHFGGGGHIRAAGAIIPGKIEDVKTRVVAEVLKYVQASQYLV